MFEDHFVLRKLRDKVKVALNPTEMICGWPGAIFDFGEIEA